MITLNELYTINKYLINTFGGSGIGFTDENLAHSCVVQIYQEVFGSNLYPTVESKISFIVFSIIANHIFIDGNKRTGIAVLEKLCKDNSLLLNASDDELIKLAINIARSLYTKNDVENWIITHTMEAV